MNVAIVGAGIHGVCAALAIARRGHHVTVIDRAPLGGKQGSSHGRSRIVRKAYPDPFYTGIMAHAYPLWEELQEQCATEFLYEVGLAYFGRQDSPTLLEVESSLIECQQSVRRMDADEPPMRLEADEMALFSTGGWVHAERAIAAIAELAVEAGARFTVSEAPTPAELAFDFDRVVWLPGAWIRDIVPADVRVTVQTVAYVDVPTSGPVWIEDGPDFLYGFPSEPGATTSKVGVHTPGPEWNLRDERPGPDPRALELILDFARRRWGAAQPTIVETATCLYTTTPNEDFRWGSLGPTTFWASPCSGHGFKFGPWIGERLADLVEGKLALADYPRFLETPT